LDGPGIESWWGWDFLHPSRPALGPTQPPVQQVSSLKSSQSVMPNPHPLLVPLVMKVERAIPLLPYGPYGLYRASVPIQGCTLLFFYSKGCQRMENKNIKAPYKFTGRQ
jgi:hypothetical protein